MTARPRSRGEWVRHVTQQPDCIFCPPSPDSILSENALAYAIRDAFPVSRGHVLVIPRRHVEDYFALHTDELLACSELLSILRRDLMAEDAGIRGFNVGVNAGRAAGQTVRHCHIHLIPRRPGDVQDPRGGVRWVLPERADYWSWR